VLRVPKRHLRVGGEASGQQPRPPYGHFPHWLETTTRKYPQYPHLFISY
jgi:hypothetical protein